MFFKKNKKPEIEVETLKYLPRLYEITYESHLTLTRHKSIVLASDLPEAIEQFREIGASQKFSNIVDIKPYKEELEEELEDLHRIVDLMKNRKYYSKFVSEVYQKQEGKELSYPDADYIYQLYFEQREEIERLQVRNKTLTEITKNYDWKYAKARSEARKELVHEIINDILPQYLYGHEEQAMRIGFAISERIKEMEESI